ncbi:MAG: hypothetical protein Q8Q54_11205 [Methylococcales bacterium]|nr:hypothetical protein [Methylococcales bacterium]MDP3839478.1 hypothetical protein [Methylococcales bacterium]
MLKTRKPSKLQEHDELLTSFPLPRYFQVHFQHIHERTDTVHQELAELKTHVYQLENKLDALLMLLKER